MKKMKRGLSLFLTLVMVLGMLNLTVFADDARVLICEKEEHTHTEDCYAPGEPVLDCTHVHDESCGYVEAKDEVPCNCGAVANEETGEVVHADGCAYTPTDPGSPCTHEHTEECYVPGAPVLTCGKTEHTHAEDCYAVPMVEDEDDDDSAGTTKILNRDDVFETLGNKNFEVDNKNYGTAVGMKSGEVYTAKWSTTEGPSKDLTEEEKKLYVNLTVTDCDKYGVITNNSDKTIVLDYVVVKGGNANPVVYRDVTLGPRESVTVYAPSKGDNSGYYGDSHVILGGISTPDPTPETTSVEVSKVWKNDKGESLTKNLPASVTVQLYEGDQEVSGKILTLDAENGWKGEFKCLPKKEGDKDITYTVKEVGETNGEITLGGKTYTVTYKDNEIINTLKNEEPKTETGSLTIQKMVTWNEQQSQAPTDLDNQEFTVVVKLGEGTVTEGTGAQSDGTYSYVENGKYTFTLKPGSGSGVAGDAATINSIPVGTMYTVEETKDGMPTGYSYKSGEVTTASELTAAATVTIENRYFKTILTDLTVTKKWLEGEREEYEGSYMPEVVTVNLVGGPVDLTANRTPYLWAENEWTHTWDGLPMYSAEDTPYKYSVQEIGVEYPVSGKGSNLVADTREGNVIRVRNTTNKVPGEKGEAEIVGGWLVKEDDVKNGQATITNTWIPADDLGYTSITIVKVDRDNKDVKLEGAVFELTNAEGTAWHYEGGRTDENGELTFNFIPSGTYTLTEVEAPEGYQMDSPKPTWTIQVVKDGLAKVEEKDGDKAGENTWNWKPVVTETNNGTKSLMRAGTLTVTNKAKPPETKTGSLTITKGLAGEGASAAANKDFTFTVTGPNNYKETVTITGANSKTLADLLPGEYTVTEDPDSTGITGYSWSGNVTGSPVAIKGGDAASVTVTNTYTRQSGGGSDPIFTSLTAEKVWMGDDPANRPTSVMVQLLLNGYPNGSAVTLSASNGWTYTWSGLTTGNTWTVAEVDVPEGYTSSTSTSGSTVTITNTYSETEIPENPTPQSGTLSVNKVWAGDDEANRPESVSVQILKDGEVQETVTLDSANGWSWSHVLSEEELASKWTVSEVEVPEGYTSVVTTGDDGISFTVTNTFASTNIPDEGTPTTDVPTTDVPDTQPPLVDVPDVQPPLVDVPDVQPPLVEVPDVQPPLVVWPDPSWPETIWLDPADQATEIPVEDVPLAEIPGEDVPLANIPDGDVPMTGVPQTGDISLAWYVVAILSAMGLAVLTPKKREGEED